MDLLAAATQVLAMARAHDVRLATAESCTGGLIFATLTEIAGSSDVMDRGFVTYSNAAKRQMLGVPATLIAAHGAVSREVAAAMATGALARSDAQVAIAVTGVAGPGGTPLKPEGMVCFGLARKGRACRSEIVEFGAIGRAQVRHQTTAHALALLLQDIPHPA